LEGVSSYYFSSYFLQLLEVKIATTTTVKVLLGACHGGVRRRKNMEEWRDGGMEGGGRDGGMEGWRVEGGTEGWRVIYPDLSQTSSHLSLTISLSKF
jgi:hypothetical protein